MYAYDPRIKIYLFGSSIESINKYPHLDNLIEFKYELLGEISIDDCNELYNKCKLGISLSLTNPSRIPFEMMTAGLPVIDLLLENNMYDFGDSSICLATPSPEGIASAIVNLIDDDAKLNSMSQSGIKFMADRTLEHELQHASEAINNVLSDSKDLLFNKKINKSNVVKNKILLHCVLKENDFKER